MVCLAGSKQIKEQVVALFEEANSTKKPSSYFKCVAISFNIFLRVKSFLRNTMGGDSLDCF